MKISAVILNKNKVKEIEILIKSLNFCDEIIVIDDYSSEDTNKLENIGIKFVKRYLNNNFADQKNSGLKLAKNEWVLYIDSDEVLSDALVEEIKKIDLNKNEYNGFYIKRIDYFLGNKINFGEVWGKKYIRLAKKTKGHWKRRVHEYWYIEGKIGVLKHPIIHKTNNTLGEFLKKINFYSDLHAIENKFVGKKSNLFKIIFYPIIKFKLNFFFKLGFLDGIYGFIHAIFMSLHSFLSWSKLWIIQKKEKS